MTLPAIEYSRNDLLSLTAAEASSRRKNKMCSQHCSRQSFVGSRTLLCVYSHRQSSEATRQSSQHAELSTYCSKSGSMTLQNSCTYRSMGPGNSNPPWLETKLAEIQPGSLQSNIFSWNKRLARYTKAGQYFKTIELFHKMQQEGMRPDKFTFVPVLNACSSLQALDQGRSIHLQIIRAGHELDVYVGSCLVDMYAKCGCTEDASRVFSKMPVRDVVSWTAMILGYVKSGQGWKALKIYDQMQREGVKPNPVTFLRVLSACASVGALEEGRHVHEQIIERGFESDIFLGNCLIDMYAKCGSIDDAWRVFSKMPMRDVVCWTAMIIGYVKCGQGQKALKLSREMQLEGVDPDPVTFVGMLNACATVADLEEGKHVHEQIIQSGSEADIFVGSSLVDMYVKCGSLEEASKVFDRMVSRDEVAWSAMIVGCVKCGQSQKALELFRQMLGEGVEPNHVTYLGVLNACASLMALEEGQRVHKQIIQGGYESDVFVSNCLVNMYAKCGSMEDAWKVFIKMPMHDVGSWTAMILGYVKCGQGQRALELFQQMDEEGVEPNALTFVGVLNACASIAALEEGRQFHKRIFQSGHVSDLYVGNSLIDMYAKCGSIEDARRVFNKMRTRDVVSWNSMLGAYAIHGHANEVLGCFEEMCKQGMEMNEVTFISLLSACSHAGLVDEGMYFFESMGAVYRNMRTVDHYACVVDLLGRAGRLHEAEDLIMMQSNALDSHACMSLLGASTIHGNGEIGERLAKEVLELNPENAAGYVLLSSIYTLPGMSSSAIFKQEVMCEGKSRLLLE